LTPAVVKYKILEIKTGVNGFANSSMDGSEIDKYRIPKESPTRQN
jgi:hypothetical protein